MTYDDMNNTYGNVTSHQLTSIVEECINQLHNTGMENKEDIDILHPLSTVFCRCVFSCVDDRASFLSKTILFFHGRVLYVVHLTV